MSALADAEIIAALSAKCAQLTASLEAAEATIRTLRQQGGAEGGRAGAASAAAADDSVDMNELARHLVARLKTAQLLDLTLWSADEIAGYLKTSRSQVTQRYAPLANFPRAIRLPTADGNRSHPRWKAAEVVAWAERYQDKKRAV